MNLLKTAFYTISFIALLMLSSCEYQTDKIYFKEVNKDVSQPDLTVNLNLNSDTIYIYSYSTIKLSLQLTNKTLYAVKFFLDGNEYPLANYSGDVNTYSFDINLTGEPVTKVRAEIYTSTGTGSIADKIGAESFIFKSKEWVLINVPDKPVITSEVIDGRLKISWTPIKSSLKSKYLISTSYHKDSTYNNWYIDSTYVGGQNYISLEIKDNDVSGYHAYSEINYPFPTVFIDNKDKFKVCWEKCKFYNNIAGYSCEIDNEVYNTKISDTTFVYKNGILGHYTYVTFGLLLKDYYKDNSKVRYYFSNAAYYPIDWAQKRRYIGGIFYPYTGNTFYFWSDDNGVGKLYKYSLDTKTYTSQVTSPSSYYSNYSVSPNNKYILYDNSGNLKLMATDGMINVKDFPIKNISPSGSYYGSNVSDLATIVYWNYVLKSLTVYDILNEKPICNIPFTDDYFHQGSISANGKYVFEPWTSTIYKIENNSYTKVWSYPNTTSKFKFYQFSPDMQTTIALYDGSTFYLKNCSDFSTLASFSLNNNEKVINVDFEKKKILTYNNLFFYVYSLADGKLLNSIRTSNYVNTRLFDDNIFMENVQLNLNDL